MSLIPPKRLFHVPSMSTVMYEDVTDDVKEKGYVAISHVWGNQQIHYTTQFGIKNGIDWGILLSDPKKISRLVDAMKYHEKEYCWMDILCMPQDKQDEINLEIPLMGDYYSGAHMTLVLSDESYVISDDYVKWYDMMRDISTARREITKDEQDWLSSHKSPILDFSRELWFTRVWTLQESLLSKKIVLVSANGHCFNMTNMLIEMVNLEALGTTYMAKLFSSESVYIIDLGKAIKDINSIKNLKSMTGLNWRRNCGRDLDKYYGILGILGYKDFVVDYNTNIHDLAEKMIRHSYSKGDVSWIAVGGKNWPGFLQPMYEPSFINENWEEREIGACNVRLSKKSLHIDVAKYGKITHCRWVEHGENGGYAVAFDVFKSWGFSNEETADCVTQYGEITDGGREVFYSLVDLDRGRKTSDDLLLERAYRIANEPGEHIVSEYGQVFGKDINMAFAGVFECRDYYPCVVAKVMCNETKKFFPLMISGNAHVGDEIAFVKMRDFRNRVLGFVISGNNRRGIFLCREMEIKDELYKPHEFALWLPSITTCCLMI